MRILGLDPGSRFTGWGAIEQSGSRSTLIAQGRVSCPARAPLPERLELLATSLEGILDLHAPDVAVLETAFHGVNPRSLIVLSQARGALLVTLARRGVQIEEFSPAEIKSAVTGHGRADKRQVERMVGILLDARSEDLTPDAADALAVALCFAAHRPLHKAVARQRQPE